MLISNNVYWRISKQLSEQGRLLGNPQQEVNALGAEKISDAFEHHYWNTSFSVAKSLLFTFKYCYPQPVKKKKDKVNE